MTSPSSPKTKLDNRSSDHAMPDDNELSVGHRPRPDVGPATDPPSIATNSFTLHPRHFAATPIEGYCLGCVPHRAQHQLAAVTARMRST
ncbi:MAG: hypothetical protein WCR59_08680, partial [Planctomycetota bacterium]